MKVSNLILLVLIAIVGYGFYSVAFAGNRGENYKDGKPVPPTFEVTDLGGNKYKEGKGYVLPLLVYVKTHTNFEMKYRVNDGETKTYGNVIDVIEASTICAWTVDEDDLQSEEVCIDIK